MRVDEFDRLDKGTYDAIALSGKSEDGKTIVSRYPPKVAEALKSGGMFLITCRIKEGLYDRPLLMLHLSLQFHRRRTQRSFWCS
jgi:hypothetical protein